ncbi:thiamine pyrophosphate-binding protein [Streptosporangium sp. NPDC049644]|uniref:thiamine pyrophosphate-binding protein n=1 Tax=Streptosporangium sp. NPDC049644 TaxID=3155507 RepID=UPI00343C5E9F
MVHRNGGDLLVDVLRDHGVDTVFGVISVHNLPLVEALDRDLRFVPVRHEAAAVNAADGYARATGGLGVAVTSTGTGAGNAAGSLVEALSAGSRVLHITGQIDSEYLGQGRGVIHETPEQLAMLRAVSKHAAAVPSAELAEETLRTAVAFALSAPQGPASVEWPIDLQYARQPTGATTAVPEPPPAGSVPTEPLPTEPLPTEPLPAESVRAVAAMVAAARRPLIWAGGGARTARAQLLELAERLGAPVLTSNAGRGVIDEAHELVVGNYASSPRAEPLITSADLLISVGTHFRSNETRQYQVPLPAEHVQIDVDPAAIGRSYPASAGLVGDAATVLSALLTELTEAGTAVGSEPGWREQGVATREAVREHQRAAIGCYAEINDSLRNRLAESSVIARDVTVPSSTWGNRLLEIRHPSTNIFPLGGGIGQGLAMGIGAAVSRPDAPTVVIAGDGGLAVHLGELGTLAQERPWLVLVVFNDGGYGVLRSMQESQGRQPSAVDLFTPDFGALATSFAIPYALVQTVGSFDKVLGEALATRAPYLIEVDMTTLPPMPTPFVPPVHVPQV